MGKIAAYLLAGIGVGIGVAYWQCRGHFDAAPPDDVTVAATARLERRLSELETSLALERFERQALADELASLRAAVAVVPDSAGVARNDSRERADAVAGQGRGMDDARVRERFPDGFPQTAVEREQYLRQRQLDNYVEAGLSRDRAQWIMQREDELAIEALNARYEAAQAGASDEEVANLTVDGLLREELGDADYEKYLEGRGRPTTVNVRDVLTNSPAQTAGLRAGDQIVAYNGQRVFDIGELTEMTNRLKPGQTVALDIERDGQPMQVYIASGPIGISGGGRSTRRGEPGGFGGGR